MIKIVDSITSTGLLISIKNGAGFEAADEQGFTHLAEYCTRSSIFDKCEEAGIFTESFWVSGDTSRSTIELAIFFAEEDRSKATEIIKKCLQEPLFLGAGIRDEMKILRKDLWDSRRDIYWQASVAITRMLMLGNPSVFGSSWWHLLARGPQPEKLQEYWQKLLTSSNREIILFGKWSEEQINNVSDLSSDKHTEVVVNDQQIERRELKDEKYVGVLWQFRYCSPLFALVDTVMKRRSERSIWRTRLLTYHMGSWLGYALLPGSNDRQKVWTEFFSKEVNEKEWMEAKMAYKLFVDVVISGLNIRNDVFYWSDCMPEVIGLNINSLPELAKYIEESTFEDFQQYWVQTVG